MSVKFTYLLHWLSIGWPYAVATLLAIFFVILKGFPILKEWFHLGVFKWNLKKLGLAKVQPQLVTADGEQSDKFAPKKKPPFKKTDQQSLGRGKGADSNDWLLGICVANVFVGFVILIVWFLGR